MFYCQRCGRQIADDELRCHFCGIVQEREGTSIETKPCKKCKEAIPVNANYCPYCGLDQATLFYDEMSFDDSKDDQKEIRDERENEDDSLEDPLQTLESFEINDPSDVEKFLQKIEEESNKIREANAKKYHIAKNESEKPGLIVSTKLMLKDWLTVDKRMGTGDFWWGYLGMYLLTIIVSVIMGAVLAGIHMYYPKMVGTAFDVMFTAWMIFFFITTITAFIRRFHDSELPMFMLVFRFIPVAGELFCLFFAMRPQMISNDRYTFESKSKRKKRTK